MGFHSSIHPFIIRRKHGTLRAQKTPLDSELSGLGCSGTRISRTAASVPALPRRHPASGACQRAAHAMASTGVDAQARKAAIALVLAQLEDPRLSDKAKLDLPHRHRLLRRHLRRRHRHRLRSRHRHPPQRHHRRPVRRRLPRRRRRRRRRPRRPRPHRRRHRHRRRCLRRRSRCHPRRPRPRRRLAPHLFRHRHPPHHCPLRRQPLQLPPLAAASVGRCPLSTATTPAPPFPPRPLRPIFIGAAALSLRPSWRVTPRRAEGGAHALPSGPFYPPVHTFYNNKTIILYISSVYFTRPRIVASPSVTSRTVYL